MDGVEGQMLLGVHLREIDQDAQLGHLPENHDVERAVVDACLSAHVHPAAIARAIAHRCEDGFALERVVVHGYLDLPVLEIKQGGEGGRDIVLRAFEPLGPLVRPAGNLGIEPLRPDADEISFLVVTIRREADVARFGESLSNDLARPLDVGYYADGTGYVIAATHGNEPD